MKTIFLIETDPIKKDYYTDTHCGYINTSNSVKKAKQYNSYEEANKDLVYIITSDFDSEKTLYLSIVNFIIKN